MYENPGPEKYNQKNAFKFKSNPKFSFGVKSEVDRLFRPNDTPGVGEYELSGKMTSTGKAIGKERRKARLEGQAEHPGPA